MLSDPQRPPSSSADFASTGDLVPGVMRFARLVMRRSNVVVACLAVCGAIGAAYYITAPRYYSSTAKLLIIEQKSDQLASVGDADGSETTMATQREIVVSPVVLKRAIDQLAPQDRIDLVDVPPHN